MSKEKWKRNIRRWPALALTLVMTLSIASCGAARGSLAGQAAGRRSDNLYGPAASFGDSGKVHESVPYSERPYEHYDPAVMEQAMADLNRPAPWTGRTRRC